MGKKKEGTWVQYWCEKCNEYVTLWVVKGKGKCPKCGEEIS